MGFTEIFVSTHDAALKRAGILDDGGSPATPGLRIPGISDFEIEQLGDLAGAAVHAGGADYELAMVDVASDSLLGVPPAMVRALAELLSYETEGEGNVLDDVADTSVVNGTVVDEAGALLVADALWDALAPRLAVVG